MGAADAYSLALCPLFQYDEEGEEADEVMFTKWTNNAL